MLDHRLTFTQTHALAVPADALVVEDDGWLSAARGLAAQAAGLYPELQTQRERALHGNGGPFSLGSVIAFRVNQSKQGLRSIVWAVTWSYPDPDARRSERRIRATPLTIAEVTQKALLHAAAQGARHVVMPTLGTRIDQHVLPPNPKKLPRYVMGSAQLIASRLALQSTPSLHVTLSVTERDLSILRELLGQAGHANSDEDEERGD